MVDILDNTILCSKCSAKMQRKDIYRCGFLLRTMICPRCNTKIIHPLDEDRYRRFIKLKNKEFKVKMRLIGNSYAVSIPKEIVMFMNAQEKIINQMVKFCFDGAKRLSLNFEDMK